MKSVFSFLALAPVAFAAFGVQTSGSDMVVDSGDKLVFTVNTKSGDITSIKYSGTELQDKSKFTQLSSGLGSADVSSTSDNGVAVVTISTDTINHYYIVKEGENTIYIGTNASKEPDVGELRYIARLNKSAVPKGIPESDVAGGDAIEGCYGERVRAGTWLDVERVVSTLVSSFEGWRVASSSSLNTPPRLEQAECRNSAKPELPLKTRPMTRGDRQRSVPGGHVLVPRQNTLHDSPTRSHCGP
ncbi:Rhamnogalacturonase B, N-terminal-domain-containing protein [Schizophyllum commune]